jgi:type 1 glutamine amidotransferase
MLRSFTCCIFLSLFATTALAHDKDGKPVGKATKTGGLQRVLLFSGTGWYRHPEIPQLNGWLVRLGAEHGIEMDVSETGADITPEKLSGYQVVLLNNANMLDKVLDEKQRDALKAWYQQGHGIVALHAVLVHQEGWPWLQQLAGCDFNSDSDFLKAKVIVDPQAKDHPAVKGQPAEFFYSADWTNHDKSVTGLPGVQVLLRVDESTYDPVREYFKTRSGKAMGKDHPIAWLREHDGGRFFYTELGHDVRSLDTKFGRQHVLEALRWATPDAPNKKPPQQ